MILVSIIVPVYNTGKYLDRCLDSIQSQTLKEIEIIVVNDGSTDSSLDIIKKHMENDSRIVLINQENGGQSLARNNGIKIAKGKYIGFVDSDDYIEENMYEVLYKMAEENSTDIAICNVNRVYEDSKVLEKKCHEKLKDECVDIEKYGRENYIMNYLRKYIHANEIYCRIFKTEVIHKNGISFDINADKSMKEIGEDIIFNIKVAIYAKNIIATEESYYNYVVRNGSTMTSEKNNLLQRYLCMQKQLNKFLLERINDKEKADKIIKRVLISMIKEAYYVCRNDKKVDIFIDEWQNIKNDEVVKEYMFSKYLELNFKELVTTMLFRFNLFKIIDFISK